MAQQTNNHRCAGTKAWIEVRCECGWISTMHSGRGARAGAYHEWREHKARHTADASLLKDANSHYSSVQLDEMAR